MTTEELFAQMEAQAANEKEYCVIDPITREISVPEVYQKIGVVSDEKTNRIYFQCPRIVGDNVDLTKYGIRVNYQNANGQTKPYPVDDVAVSGDNITFSWLLDRPVTTYKGTINFVVCAIKTSGDEITNEWNTTLAKAEVLEGLEPDISITEDEESIVELLVAQCTQKITEMNMAIQTSENATNDAKTATQEAVNATEDARSVIEQITKDSYLHTALETFINEVTAKPTAYGNTLVEKIEGYIRQTATKGNQLFDSSSLTAYNEATFSVLNGGKDVKVTGRKTSESAKSSVIYQMKSALIELIKGKTLYVYVNHDAENGWFEFGMQSESTGWTYRQVTNKQWTEVNIPSDLKTTSIALIPNAKTEENITTTFKDIKIGLSRFEEWEPYTGGEPAPSPDYPQTIHGVGDMGFFDGELLQGVYSAGNGSYSSANTSVCNANKIPAKQGDIVRIEYEEGNKNLYIIAYDKSGKFLKSYVESSGKSYLSTEALPANTDYVNFNIQSKESASLPVSSAKHITVTINGMYAICVKTVGKNLCSGIKMGAWLYNSGNYSADRYYFCCENLIPVKPNTTYIVKNFSSALECNGFCFYTKDRQYISADGDGLVKTTTPENCYFLTFNLWNREETYTLTDVQNVQLEEGESATEYVPYQGKTIYIPISYPLFDGDKLIKGNKEYKILRKKKLAVFDGDEVWSKATGNESAGLNNFATTTEGKIEFGYCDKFKSQNTAIAETTEEGILFHSLRIYVRIKSSKATDASGFKTWLQSNPITCVYTLANPIEEELSPEAQKAIHSIMACDEQTTIEIVGVPTDAEAQNQFLLPRNVDGALNTTAFATSKRNEITLEEQSEQLSQVVTQAITLAKAQEV